MIDERPVHPVEPRAGLGKVHADVGEHARILRSFSGEQDRDLSVTAQWLLEEVRASHVPDTPALRIGKFLPRLRQPGAEIADRGRDDRQAASARRRRLGVQVERETGEVHAFRGLEKALEVRHPLDEAGARRRLQNAHLAVPTSLSPDRAAAHDCHVHSSRMACALMPPKPNALTAARRGVCAP